MQTRVKKEKFLTSVDENQKKRAQKQQLQAHHLRGGRVRMVPKAANASEDTTVTVDRRMARLNLKPQEETKAEPFEVTQAKPRGKPQTTKVEIESRKSGIRPGKSWVKMDTHTYEQHRLEKCLKEKMVLVACERAEDEKGVIYHVQGGSGNTYKLTLGSLPVCSCPDQRVRQGLCKHILFVLIKILKVTPRDIESGVLPEDEKRLVLDATDQLDATLFKPLFKVPSSAMLLPEFRDLY